MPENIGDAEVSIGGNLSSLREFVQQVQRALRDLEKGKFDVTLKANDKVTPEVAKVTKKVDELSKKKATPKLAAEDRASTVLEKVGRGIKKVHGQQAVAKVDVRDEATAKLEKIGSSIKRYISGATIMAGVYLLGRAVKSLGGSMIDGAADMEQYKITLETVMGSAEKAADTMSWVVQFAKQTPFEIPGLMEATVRLQAYGIDATKVLGTIGDASAALGKDVMEGVEAVADAQTGEFERLKEFGIKAVEVGKDQLKQYALGADAMGKTMLLYTDKNGKEAFKLVDRNNREIVTSNLMAIWNERYAGNMARQSTSWKGMVSNIKDSVTMGLTKVGEAILPKLKPYLDKALAYLSSDKFSEFINKIADGVTAAIPKIAEFARTVWDFIKSAWDAFAGPAFAVAKVALGTFSGILKLLGDNMNIIKPIVIGLVGAFAGFKIVQAVAGWMNGLSGLWGILTGGARGAAGAISGVAGAATAAGQGAATASSGISGMIGPIGAAAGAAVGLGLTIWQTIDAENKRWEAWNKSVVEAGKMTGELDKLRTATSTLKAGTDEYTAALDAQAQKAQEITEKTGSLGAVYDGTGRLIDANTRFINFLAAGASGASKEVSGLAAKSLAGKDVLAQTIPMYDKTTKSLDAQKKTVEQLEQALMEKHAKGQEASVQEWLALDREQQKYNEMANGAALAFDTMKSSVDSFGTKITGPGGLSAMTGKDVTSMIKMMSDKTPEVQQQGLRMMQMIIDAEAQKNPAIQQHAQEIMDGIKRRIEQLPAGEKTAQKMTEIIREEATKYGPITAEMQKIMDGLGTNIDAFDGGAKMSGKMEEIESRIRNSSAPSEFRNLVEQLAQLWASWTPEEKVLYITTSAEIGEASKAPQAHTGGEIGRFGVKMHGGGEVGITAKVGEFMMREEAVDEYGLPLMRAINNRQLNLGGNGSVHHHNWGPVNFPNVTSGSDAQAIRDEMNKMAEEAEDRSISGAGF